jgi:hypothetical protein
MDRRKATDQRPAADTGVARVPHVAREVLAAGLGCAIADGSLNWLEVTKVKLQVQPRGHAPYYTGGMLGCMRKSIAEDGFLAGMWLPGLGPTTVRAFTYVGFRVGMFPTVREWVQETQRQQGRSGRRAGSGAELGLHGRILAGAITGGVGSALFCPIDVVRVRMQADAGTPGEGGRLMTGLRRGLPVRLPGGTFSALAHIRREEGLAGLYRGSLATIARAALLSGSQLGSYDGLKRAAKQRLGWTEGLRLHLTCSLACGLIAQSVIMPVDVWLVF